MKKKSLAWLLLLLLCPAVTLAGCATEPGQADGSLVSIKYWNLMTGADGPIMKEMVAAFNEEYKGRIEVIDESANEDTYYDNLQLNIPIGRGPDVAIVHSWRVQSYANQGLIVPMDEMISAAGIDMGDYPEQIVDSLSFEGKTYAIPLDMHPIGIYYNKDLLEQYGLEVPTNRDELIAAAKKADNRDGGVWGLPLSSQWPSDYVYTTALYQFGGKEVTADDLPGFNTQAGIQALEAFADLVHKYGLSQTSLGNDQDLALFRSGKALFHLQGSWMLNSLKTSKINFGIIPLSMMFNPDSDAIAVRSHTFVLPAQKREDAAKRDAAMEFIEWMTKNSHVWATAGQVPASASARAKQEYKEIPYVSDFGDPANFMIGSSSPYYFEAYTPVYSRVTQALLKPDYDAPTLLAEGEEEGKKMVQELKEILGQ